MTVILSSSLYSSPHSEVSLKNGIVLSNSVVTIDSVEATGEDEDYPISNVANPSTNLIWRGDSAGAHSITINVPESHTDVVDGVGIAGANFSSAGISFDVYARDNDEDDESWIQLTYPLMRADDGPILLRGPANSWRQIRIDMTEGSEPPEIAVLYVGELLVLERGIYVGHTPIVDGLVVRDVSGRSVDGNYLGNIVLSEYVETTISLNNLTPGWYRENMRPLLARRDPFFYSWRPATYPNEVGFVWIPPGSSPRPVNSRANGMMRIDVDVQGIVR